ncbi:MAG TPA: hypothetical protein VHL34_21155 [Rhizomicrobium sp.]|nr:hypothetical protein [Rhizomicrobium sp.]
MKKLAMAALGALMMAGTTAATTAPAEARVVVGIGFGGGGYYAPGYHGGYGYRVCDPYSRYYNPYRCEDDRYYSDYYYDPIYFGGGWYRGPFRYRDYRGYREFWVNGGWHRNEWRGHYPTHYSYRGGWYGSSHPRYSGHTWNGDNGHNWTSNNGHGWNGGNNGGGHNWNGGGHNGHHH